MERLQDELIIRPALREGTHVVLDNACHKILARCAVNAGVPTDLARQVFAHLAEPEMVLFLQLTAAKAMHRKQEFSPLAITALSAGLGTSDGFRSVSWRLQRTALRGRAGGSPARHALPDGPCSIAGSRMTLSERKALAAQITEPLLT